MKPKILINAADRVTFHQDCLRPMLNRYFDIVNYEPGTNYSAQEYTVMTYSGFDRTWYKELVDSGAGLILDVLWEHHVSEMLIEQHQGTAHVAAAKNYFWINEYYTHCQERYNLYQPNRQPTHRALLPICQLKPHRQQLLTALGPTVDQLLYSVVEQGRYLPNDLPTTEGIFHRYFNPEWYDSTYFSIVSETVTYRQRRNHPTQYQLHVTEKTYKPIAYRHPYIIYGQTGTLAYLHELGFETFANLFDESYDAVEDQASRLQLIVNNINEFKETAYDAVTLAKLEHNHNLFYNTQRVEQMLIADVVNPILDYVNKT